MSAFKDYLATLTHHRKQTEAVLDRVAERFPELDTRIAWNQPMFTDHGTFIIGFSPYKNHLAIAPEVAAMQRFSDEIQKAGYTQTKMLFRIGWDQSVDYELLSRLIAFNIEDKADCTTFWRS